MRLAYVTGRYPAVSHSFILREIQALRRLGVEVETLSIWRTADEDLYSKADVVERDATYSVLPLRPLRFLAAHLSALFSRPRDYGATLLESLRLSPPGARGKLWHVFYFAEAIVLWRRCRRLRIRHVHAHFTGNAAMAALLIAHLERRRGWSWSMTVHGPVEFYDVTLSRLAAKVERARLVFCISDFARSQVMAQVGSEQWEKIRPTRCGIDPGVFSHPHRSSREPGPVRILTVGRLFQLKGHAVALDAVAKLKSRGVDVEATFVGDGPTRPSLERLAGELEIDDRVTFAGAVGQDEIGRYYAAADAFCLASFAEGLPVVLMEAMAMRLPVVATRIMGVAELVEHGATGLLVPPARPDLLADALEVVAGDRALRERMGEAGRAKVVAEFDIDEAARQLKLDFEEM